MAESYASQLSDLLRRRAKLSADPATRALMEAAATWIDAEEGRFWERHQDILREEDELTDV